MALVSCCVLLDHTRMTGSAGPVIRHVLIARGLIQTNALHAAAARFSARVVSVCLTAARISLVSTTSAEHVILRYELLTLLWCSVSLRVFGLVQQMC